VWRQGREENLTEENLKRKSVER